MKRRDSHVSGLKLNLYRPSNTSTPQALAVLDACSTERRLLLHFWYYQPPLTTTAGRYRERHGIPEWGRNRKCRALRELRRVCGSTQCNTHRQREGNIIHSTHMPFLGLNALASLALPTVGWTSCGDGLASVGPRGQETPP